VLSDEIVGEGIIEVGEKHLVFRLGREFLEDVSGEELLDLGVTGYWLRNARFRVAVPIVLSAVAD
jgi:hypothetical protein